MSNRTGEADLTAKNGRARTALSVRSTEASNSEESCAVIPHAGVCGGQSGNWLSYLACPATWLNTGVYLCNCYNRMRIFKYKTFEKWARKQGMSNADLKKAVNEIQNGLIDAKLGGDVYKKRIELHGKDKRNSHRTIILMKIQDKAIFVHGFAKGEKSNITRNELEGFKIMANAFFNLNDEQIKILIDKQNLMEVL